MTNAGDGGDAPQEPVAGTGDAEEEGVAAEEMARIIELGPRAGNRSGGLAFLALAVVLAAALHFYLGGGGYMAGTLDADLRRHAELTLAAHRDNPNLVVVPAWPVRMYEILRRDLLLYLGFVALASYLWGLSARARARRDAFLMHRKLEEELADVRRRLERFERDSAGDTKG